MRRRATLLLLIFGGTSALLGVSALAMAFFYPSVLLR